MNHIPSEELNNANLEKFKEHCSGCRAGKHTTSSYVTFHPGHGVLKLRPSTRIETFLSEFDTKDYRWEMIFKLSREVEQMEKQLNIKSTWCECDSCQHYKMFGTLYEN